MEVTISFIHARQLSKRKQARSPERGKLQIMKRSVFLAQAATTLSLACLSSGAIAATQKAKSSKVVTLSDGLQYTDTVVGTGDSPKPGQQVTVNYVGMLTDGTKFDASADHGEAFTFTIGVGQVIRGWDEGVASMKVGGKRRLTVPPELGYGSRGNRVTLRE